MPRDGIDDGFIDGKVYTKNRMMRTLHSCKRGSPVCFERVAALCSPKIRDTASEWYGAFITNVDAAAPWWIDGKTVRRAARAHARQTALTVGENLLKKRAPPGRTLQAVVPGGSTAKRQRIAHPPVPVSILTQELDPPSAFARDFLGTRSVLQYDKVRFPAGLACFSGVGVQRSWVYFVGERAGFFALRLTQCHMFRGGRLVTSGVKFRHKSTHQFKGVGFTHCLSLNVHPCICSSLIGH